MPSIKKKKTKTQQQKWLNVPLVTSLRHWESFVSLSLQWAALQQMELEQEEPLWLLKQLWRGLLLLGAPWQPPQCFVEQLHRAQRGETRSVLAWQGQWCSAAVQLIWLGQDRSVGVWWKVLNGARWSWEEGIDRRLNDRTHLDCWRVESFLGIP